MSRKAPGLSLVIVVRHAPLQETVFSVRERFKGRPPDFVRIAFGDSDCEYLVPPVAPRRGERYLIFASRRLADGHGSIDRLEATRCLGTAPVADAAQDLRGLRARPPSD